MKLKSTVRNADFIPMIKKPRFWLSPVTLKFGSLFDVEDDIGHQLLATFPGSFEVVSYESKAKRTKQIDTQAQISHSDAVGGMIAE